MQGQNYLTRYEQLDSLKLRGRARHLALSSLSFYSYLTGNLAYGLKKNRIQFLYFHHIFEDEEEAFRRLLKTLSTKHRFISYSRAVEKLLKGPIDEAYIAISFDDGFKNCLKASEILKEFGATACFFICPSIVGETDDLKIKAFCLQKLRLPPVEFLNWKEIEILLNRGDEIGSHTMSHPDLSQLSLAEIKEEIVQSFQVLKTKTGDLKHFCWPYGRFSHFNPAAAEIVFAAGFQSCASAERGCHLVPHEEDPTRLCIRRDQTIAKWPIHHVLYFLARNACSASIRSNQWPSLTQKATTDD